MTFLNTSEKNKNSLLFVIFFFMTIPVIMHLYGALFDIITYGNFYILLLLNIFIVIFLGIKRISYNTIEIKIIFIFLSLVFIDAIFFNIDNISDSIKYLFYFIFYFLFIKSYINKISYYKYFIRFVSIILLIDLFLFFLIPSFPDLSSSYARETLSLLHDTSAFKVRSDWNYSLPLYLYVYPINIPQDGIFFLPRFFGFSPEPTLLSCILLPLLFIAYYEKEKICFIIIFVSFILASSYGAIAILTLALIYFIFFKQRNKLTIIIFIIAFISLYFLFNNNILFESDRISLYANLVLNILKIDDISLFASNYDSTIQFPTAILTFYMKYGLLPLLSYIFFLIYLFKISSQIDRNIFVFTIAFILMLNKSGEIISPLFLFYVNYIYVYKNKEFK
jgi:hypothetical protein